MDIRALAKHLNISIGTVSRALNDGRDVSNETRQRVIEAAAALGYTPNQSGRSLRRGRTGTVAFVLPVTAESSTYGEAFFMAVLAGVHLQLENAGLELVVLPVRRDQDELQHLLRHVGRGTADAWLLAEIKREDDRIALFQSRGIPFATFGRSLTPGTQPCIDLDFERMTRDAVGRLAGAGHRRIAIITPGPRVNFSHVVLEAYQSMLRQAGLPFDDALVYRGDVDPLASFTATSAFMSLGQPPSAIFVISENGPIGVYASLRARGLEPGRDVSVIGSRNTAACVALDPPLTCFSLDLSELGAAWAGMLTDRMSASATGSPAGDVLWPLKLVDGISG